MQRPWGEHRVLTQQPEEMIVEHRWNTKSAVVPSKQELEQIGLLPDRLGCDPKDVAQHEPGGMVFTKGARRWLACLGFVQCVKVAPLQRVHHRMAQVREQVAQGERDVTTLLQQVVRQFLHTGDAFP